MKPLRTNTTAKKGKNVARVIQHAGELKIERQSKTLREHIRNHRTFAVDQILRDFCVNIFRSP